MAGTLTVSLKLSPFPFAAVAIAAYTQKADLVFDEAATTVSLALNGSEVTTEHEVVQTLAKAGRISDDSAKVSTNSTRFTTLNLLKQSQSFFVLASSLSKLTAFPEIVAALDSLDDYLAFRTFLVGHDITATDWIIWGAMKGLYQIRSSPHIFI